MERSRLPKPTYFETFFNYDKFGERWWRLLLEFVRIDKFHIRIIFPLQITCHKSPSSQSSSWLSSSPSLCSYSFASIAVSLSGEVVGAAAAAGQAAAAASPAPRNSNRPILRGKHRKSGLLSTLSELAPMFSARTNPFKHGRSTLGYIIEGLLHEIITRNDVALVGACHSFVLFHPLLRILPYHPIFAITSI